MSVLRLKSKNENIDLILYNLVQIWNNKLYAIRAFGNKDKGFGLKQNEFSDFEDTENTINERKFREYKDEMMETALIREVFTKNKKKGRPFYQITPMGISYLLQSNFEITERNEKQCFDILIFYNNTLNLKWKDANFGYLKQSCSLVSGDDWSTDVDSILGNDEDTDQKIKVAYIPHNKDIDYKLVAFHILGNMCWFAYQYDRLQVKVGKWAKSVGNDQFIVDRQTQKTIKTGKEYGKMILKLLEQQSKEIFAIIK